MSARIDGLTVILCVHNGENRLPQTLAHLASQEQNTAAERELILVDNASTDSSSAIGAEIWSGLGNPYPLRVVRENKQGLAWARRTGVMSARYAYGLFCDDDNWLGPDYLDTVYKVLSSDATIGAVGGSSVPASELQLPAWFFNRATSFAVGVQSFHEGDCTSRGFLWGAGLGVRLSNLKDIYRAGVVPLNVGRSGKNLSSGDDYELCQWFIFSGLRLVYSSTLSFTHFFPAERLSREYLDRFSAAQIDVKITAMSSYFNLFHRPFLPHDSSVDGFVHEPFKRARQSAKSIASLLFLLSKPLVARAVWANAKAVNRAAKDPAP